MEREVLEVDVLIVGGGPAGLAAAIRLMQLQEEARGRGEKREDLSVCLLEKGEEVGSLGISGCVLDPRSLRELLPDFQEQGAPVTTEVASDEVLYLTAKGARRLPFVPGPLKNHGNYIISLGRLVRWMAEKAEGLGVDIFPGFAAAEPILDGGRLGGVITDDKGRDKSGEPKSNFQAGYEIRAKVTMLGEGPRGSMTKQLIETLRLDEGKQPQVYAVGIKEVWKNPGKVRQGHVIHTMGWPLGKDTFGGGFVYGMADDLWSVGLVVGLDYRDPYLEPHLEFQRFKTHPSIRPLLEGGQIHSYGAKTIPEGGWYAMPRLQFDGGMLIGDSAGFLNGMRLKGVHLAIQSGKMAAETAFEALGKGDGSAAGLAGYEARFRDSWAGKELWGVRNFHQGFQSGMWMGMLNAGVMMMTGGRGLRDPWPQEPGHERMRKVAEVHGAGAAPFTRDLKFDGTLTFDKVTDVFHSGSVHEEDQPCHLRVADTDLCVTRCTEEYANPCERFCPASVYEMVDAEGDGGGRKLQINASNCVHCKACDIMDPYQQITWVVPEGGGGPKYKDL